MPAAQRISFDVTDEEGVIAYNPHCIDKKKGIAVNFPVKMVVWACDEDVTFDTWDSVEQGLRRQFSTAMEAPDDDGKVYYIDADEVFYSQYEPDYRDGEGFSNVEEYIEWYKEQIRDSEVDRDSSYGGAIVNLTKDEANAWNKGTSLDSYRFMGSHEISIDGVNGVVFRVWAPNAIRVSVVGDFNNWDGHAHPMMFDDKTGIFSLFVPELDYGCEYLYEICAKGGAVYSKLDPYSTQIKDDHSVVCKNVGFKWTDKAYIENRKR